METTSHEGPLAAGSVAPDFELPVTPDQKVALSDFRGRPAILVFYPEDWSPVCSDQLGLYQAVLPEFQRFGAQLLAISVDSVGATWPSPRTATSTSRCSPTSTRRGRWPAPTASTATTTGPASARCSWSMPTA